MEGDCPLSALHGTPPATGLTGRFDPDRAKNTVDVISLLRRRAGYPYDTPGEFYAVAIRDFSTFLLVGGWLAGALAAMNIIMVAPVIAGIFILFGLRRPYGHINTLAKKRAELLRNNMLIGLSVLGSLPSSSVQGLRESVHRSVVEATETRTALLRQCAGLFGVMAVLGLVLAIIAPFMGSGLF